VKENKETDSLEIQKQILKRLNVITGLLLEFAPPNPTGIKKSERIGKLSAQGLRPIEIAEVLGISQTHVNKELSLLRKQKSTGKG